MSEDIAFRIQLGVILPKLKSQVGDQLRGIIDELVGIVQAGTLTDEKVSLDAVKEIMMKDLEILLDDAIFPEIDKQLNPPPEEPEGAAEGEGDQEAAEGGGE